MWGNCKRGASTKHQNFRWSLKRGWLGIEYQWENSLEMWRIKICSLVSRERGIEGGVGKDYTAWLFKKGSFHKHRFQGVRKSQFWWFYCRE